MKRYLGCGVVLMGLLLASNACADGNELLTQCTAAVNFLDGTPPNDDVGAGFCFGLMEGIIGMNKTYEILLGKKALFCTGEAVIANGQAARIVVKYLRDHPEKLHEHESALAIRAIKEAFPCK